MTRHIFARALAVGALSLAGCDYTGPPGEPATKIVAAANNAFTWKDLCKRITVSFTDDNGTAHRWGRDEALRLTIGNAVPYATNACSGTPINNLYLGPDNTQA